MIGPKTIHAQQLHAAKYRHEGETYDDACVRIARACTEGESERLFYTALDMFRQQRLLLAGRQQLALGRAFQLTAFNCFVSPEIQDSMAGIMDACTRWALTLRMGGGIGGDFSTLRPKNELIRGLGINANSSGPVSFMDIWDAMSTTIMSAGHRRGAMMGILRVDHPDILQFVHAKAIPPAVQPLWDMVEQLEDGPQKQACAAALQQTLRLQNFNLSVAITDAFMEALDCDGLYELQWGGRSYGQMRAQDVWGPIMERAWDFAEPGAVFIDRVNSWNNLHYCEKIAASNPCAEQFLPPNGACLLWSLNLVQYVDAETGAFDFETFEQDAAVAVRLEDNVIDRTKYPLPEQRDEEYAKRRMGGGVTGLANAIEAMGHPYGTPGFIAAEEEILRRLRDACYRESVQLSRERGPFPLFDEEQYLRGKFIKTLPEDIQDGIRTHGIRNALLLSIAPTGTISQCADNVSSGIEPPYSLVQKRDVYMPAGKISVDLVDYAFSTWGLRCRTAYEVSPDEHVDVLCAAQRYMDNSVSKTVNVQGKIRGSRFGLSFDDFKGLYTTAYQRGAKAISTYNARGKRSGVITAVPEPARESSDQEAAACYVDLATGIRVCDS